MKRSHACGALVEKLVGQQVVLMGWVATYRDHGGVLFIDLRDESGIAQLVFNPQPDQALYTSARQLRSEFVIAVEGEVKPRPKGTENSKLKTGMVEVVVSKMEIYNASESLPFELDAISQVSEEVRLTYRVLDLKSAPMQETIRFRHRLNQFARNFLSDQGFVEVETPILTRSTPEGARDYLVPARLDPGTFYALPQSPQLFKQALVASGFEKYFQIARCFRDEDLRADRQPEHTQIDLEMAFVEEADVMGVVEKLVAHLFKKLLGVSLEVPFQKMTYQESMKRYGTDKPDTRFALEIQDVSEVARASELKIFHKILDQKGVVLAIATEGKPQWSREDFNQLVKWAQEQGAKGLAWVRSGDGEPTSPIAKFFPEPVMKRLIDQMKASPGEIIFFIADQKENAYQLSDMLRRHLTGRLELIPKEQYRFLWITDFPLMEYNEEDRRWVSMHHPFTSPRPEDIPLLEKEPQKVRARAYDLVLNGIEVAGGSIRIHHPDLQRRVFKILGISPEEAEQKFAFLLKALSFGAPPHGGLAMGLDRLVMLMRGLMTIRDTIAFPKTQKGTCLVSKAPAEVDPRQLRELGLHIVKGKS